MSIQLPSIIRKRGLAFRYSLFFLSGILIIFIIAFLYTYFFSRKILIEEGKKDATNLTDLTISKIENVLLPIQRVPITLVRALETPGISEDEIVKLAREFVIESVVVFGSCLAYEPFEYDKKMALYAPYNFETKTGVHFKNLGTPEYDYLNKDWYRLPKLLNRPVWTEPYFDKGGGDTLMCTFSVPFYKTVNGKQLFRGVLTMDISLVSFERIVNSVRVLKSGFGFLVSHKGKVINSPDKKVVNLNILEEVRRGGGENSIHAVEEMLKGNRGFVATDGLRSQDTPSYLCYAPVSSTGWSFAIIFPSKELFADFIDFLQKLVLIFFLSVIAILITTVLITQKFTRPISRLVDATHRIGHGDFKASLPVYHSKDEISQLTNAFSLMQEELVSYIHNLQETTTAKEKIESELNVAHAIQMGMLPKEFPVRDNWELFAMLEPAKAVGGDLYDFFFLDPDHLCIAIGDVSGKGVPASLFMTITRTLFRSKAISGIPIHEVISGINQELCKDNPNQMFVTFFAGVVDLKTATMEFSNAGHNIPLILNPSGEIKKLTCVNGIPLGITDTYVYTSMSVDFSSGKCLVMYTDGITDAENVNKDFYGEKNLMKTLSRNPHQSASDMTQQLINDVKTFSDGAEQADDITLLILKFNELHQPNNPPMQHVQLKLWNQLDEINKIVATLEEITGLWNIPPRVVMEINLVLEELFTNIVFYAFDDGQDHVIHLDIWREENNNLKFQLEDDGKPFNLLEKSVEEDLKKPLEERKIGGLGIHFAKEMMTTIDYRRTDTKNSVILTKKY